jgi:rubrerythrin
VEKKALIQIIRQAVQAEREGNLFYSAAAGAAKDPMAKRMFEQLAKDELYHVQIIEDLYHDLLPDASNESVSGFPIFEKKEMAGDGGHSTPDNEFEILHQAIQDETKARDFYQKTAETFDSEKAKEIFLDLMAIEEGHVRLLQAELDFLEKQGIYFDHMEFTVEGERD